jgi:hypothetical protein
VQRADRPGRTDLPTRVSRVVERHAQASGDQARTSAACAPDCERTSPASRERWEDPVCPVGQLDRIEESANCLGRGEPGVTASLRCRPRNPERPEIRGTSNALPSVPPLVALRRLSFGCAVIGGVSALIAVQPSAATAPNRVRTATPGFETVRTLQLPAGRASRFFTLRERSGVILVNRLTVRRGVRVTVYASIPHLAGAGVTSWPDQRGRDATLSCRRKGPYEVCNQAEEWCPMPKASWHVRLVKLAGPAGPVRFDYLVAPPQRRG